MKVANFTHAGSDFSWRELMAAVVVQAAMEAADGDEAARKWFFGNDFPIYCEAIGMDLDGPEFIRSGRYKKATHFHLERKGRGGRLKVVGKSHEMNVRTQ